MPVVSSRRRLLSGVVVAALVLLAAYVLFWYSPLAMIVADGPSLPTEGIVAVASGGESMIVGDDEAAGTLNLDDGCATVDHDGASTVLVFRAGAAAVNDDHTELRWKGQTYAHGGTISVTGDLAQTLWRLDESQNYYMPGRCPRLDRAIVVDHLPED